MILEEYPVVARDQSMLNLVHLPPCSILGHSHMAQDPLNPQDRAARQPWSGLRGHIPNKAVKGMDIDQFSLLGAL